MIIAAILALGLPVPAAQRIHNSWRSSDLTESDWASLKAGGERHLEAQLLDTGVLRVSNIHFEIGETELSPESHEVLDKVGRILMRRSMLKVEVAGHTDNVGSRASNQELSERRARAVRRYLISRYPKIRHQLVVPVGYGEDHPIASNDKAAGKAKNRRVEFVVLNEDELLKVAQMRAYRAGQ